MSIWNVEKTTRNIKTLGKDIKVDILIIGAGITGLTTAYYLKNNKSMCVVDASIVGHGVTLNSTAKINYFQQGIYNDIIKATNYSTAVTYLSAQKETISELKSIIEKNKIYCEFKKVPSYVFASQNNEVSELEFEAKFLKKNGINITEKTINVPVASYKSYYVDDTYIFNPIKYLEGLYAILAKENVNIYENSKIIKVEKVDDSYLCLGSNFKIFAKKVVLACHYPFFLFPFLMPIRCSIEKSYMVVSKANEDKNLTYISYNYPVYSCRYYKSGKDIYQISLARSHDISAHQNDDYHFRKVKEIFKLKEEDIIMEYSNSDIMTPDHMPYIGKLKDNLYIGVGYNTWGMTNGVLAAKIISDSILNKDNRYSNVFKPSRINSSILTKIPYYLFNNVKSFIGSKLNKNKEWYSKNVSIIKRNGETLGCFKDENGVKHYVKNVCPHLGCSLVFNEKEKTWDCPCHSSRFDIDGKCIKGPSKYDISYKE